MAEKVPIPRLLVTVPPAKQSRRRKTEAEKAETKKRLDKVRAKTRVSIGTAFQRWRQLRQAKGFKSDEMVALYLLQSFMKSELQRRPCAVALRRMSSTESSDDDGEPLSPSGEDGGGPSAPSLQSEHRKVRGSGGGAGTSQSEAGAAGDREELKTEDHSGSLVVGDGLHLVDLGSSAEVVVDEECLLQLLQSCLGCHRHCSIRKQAEGLKLVLNQECGHCEGGARWTNLPDDGRGGQTGRTWTDGLGLETVHPLMKEEQD